MERSSRLWAKAITWQASGIATMTLLAYLLGGSLQLAGQFALTSSAVGLVAYFVHEKIWARVKWGLGTGVHHPR